MSDFNKQSTEQLLEHLATNTSSSENMEIDINEEFLTNLLGDFKCNGAICGAKCCTNILLLTQKEIDKIRNNIKRRGIEVKSPYSIFNQEYKDRCPFVDEETFKCKICTSIILPLSLFIYSFQKKGARCLPPNSYWECFPL